MKEDSTENTTRPAEQWKHLVEPWVFAVARTYFRWDEHAHHWGHGPEMTENEFRDAVSKVLAVKVG